MEGRGQSGQAVKLFQITPCQWFPNTETFIGNIYGSVIFLNNPVPESLYRRLDKISFTFHF